MKLGFFTDLHARTDSPEGRTDDFRSTILVKLEEIGDIFKDCDAVLFGGDLFHTPDPPKSLIYDVMGIFRKWNKRIIATIGSHDYFGYQVKSLKRTALGIFQQAGVIELVGSYPELVKGISDRIWVDNETIDKVCVVATPHTYWLVEDPAYYMCAREEKPYPYVQIQLAHGDLVHKPVMWPHTLIENVITESDLVLSGHVHPGWDKPIKIANTTFYNPGSVARLENTGKQRSPKVCVIETNFKGEFAIIDHKLTSAAKHPFKVKKKDEDEVSSMQDITKLLNMIQGTEVESVDIKKQLPLVAKELGFSDVVVEKSFELIEQAGKG